MRKPITVELSEEEAATLKMWLAAGKTEQRLAKRAQVILCAASGMSLKAMEAKTGLNWQSCQMAQTICSLSPGGAQRSKENRAPPGDHTRGTDTGNGPCLHDTG